MAVLKKMEEKVGPLIESDKVIEAEPEPDRVHEQINKVDRHGIVTRTAGLIPPNPHLAAAIIYLFRHRPRWRGAAAVGKTVVSS